MVSTRRSAPTQADNDSETTVETFGRATHKTRQRVARRPVTQSMTTRGIRKRSPGERKPGKPPVSSPAARRLGKRSASRTVEHDEYEDEAPNSPGYFKTINDKAAWRPKTKGKTFVVCEDDGTAEEQLLQESQDRERNSSEEQKDSSNRNGHANLPDASHDENVSQNEEERERGVGTGTDEEYVGGREDEDQDDVDNRSQGGVEDGESSSSEDDVQEVTGSAIVPGNSSHIHNLEAVACIDVISTTMAYIEPEPRDIGVPTFNLKCDGLNTMITTIGSRHWMNQKGEWADILLQIKDKPHKESAGTKSDNCTRLFEQIITLWRNCRDMPKAPPLNTQVEFLRQHSPDIRQNLDAVHSLTGKIKSEASKPLRLRGTSKQKQDAKRKRRNLLTCMREMLVPALVLALKEALLLGGFSRLGTKPETIGSIHGQFTACTLQFALRIVGFIEQLYGVVLTHLIPETENESTVTWTQRQNWLTFAAHLQVLKPRIIGGMEELKRLAEAPIRNARWQEQARRIQEAREEADRTTREKADEQLMLFVASTQRRSGDPVKERDDYYDKHGWRLWEDEVILGVIRRTEYPNLVVLARQVPGRNIAEVISRVQELREAIKAKYEAAGIAPPKWCYW
ncbi:hypothetical protein ED733_006136 [Metarhizium rileyi]|uniref:Uncharacterized protein n=1 Tax=Metarhizium rileyi (strain RCEF 4871) TaxID=1649241 RepID=A0A5C6GAS1_METRR|nr:hypothetical protein ED733_006136 [Metarhizium rileyi]